MTVFLDKKEYRGDLFSQLKQTEQFIKNHLHLRAEILGLQRLQKVLKSPFQPFVKPW